MLRIETAISADKAAKILGRPVYSLRDRLNTLAELFILNKLELSPIFWQNKEVIVLITDIESGDTISYDEALHTSTEFHHLTNTLKDAKTHKLYEYMRNRYLTTKKRVVSLQEILKDIGDSISYDKASLNLLKLVNLDLIDIETGGIAPHKLRTIEKNQLKIAKNIKIQLKKLVEIRLVPSSVTLWTALQSYLRVIEDEETKEKIYRCPSCETESLVFMEHKDGSWTVFCQNSGCMASWYIENEARESFTQNDIFDMIIGKTKLTDVHLITPLTSDNLLQNAQSSLQKKGIVKLPYGIRIVKTDTHFDIDVNLTSTPSMTFPTFKDEDDTIKFKDDVINYCENIVRTAQKIQLLISMDFEHEPKNKKELFFVRKAQTEDEVLSIINTLIERYELINLNGGTFETKVREFRKGYPNHRFEMTIPKRAATCMGLTEGMKAKVNMHIIHEWR